MASQKCLSCGLRVGFVGLTVDALLVAMKLFVGFETGSRALMADALYSVIDVVSALLVIASFRFARKGADEEHAYGHGKIEFLAVAAVSVCIAALAFVLLPGAVGDIIERRHIKADPLAAAVTVFSIAACYLVYRYAACAGARLGSPVLLTHAEHNKADALSSAAVLASIVLSWVGLGFLDPIVAVVEIGHVLHVSVRLLRRGTDGLLDAAVDPRQVEEIRELARQTPGVLAVDRVLAREVGSSIWVELAVRVSPQRSMAQAGDIRAMLRTAALKQIGRAANVVIDVLPAVPLQPPAAAAPADAPADCGYCRESCPASPALTPQPSTATPGLGGPCGLWPAGAGGAPLGPTHKT